MLAGENADVVGAVGAPENGCPRLKVQLDVALELDRTSEVGARRTIHHAPTRGRTGVNRSLNRRSVLDVAVAGSTEVRDAHDPWGGRRGTRLPLRLGLATPEHGRRRKAAESDPTKEAPSGEVRSIVWVVHG